MPTTPAEQALSRALDYLADSGLELDDEVTRTILALIEEGLGDCPGDIVAWLMRRLPQHYLLPHGDFPAAQPPLQRGGIGYGPAR